MSVKSDAVNAGRPDILIISSAPVVADANDKLTRRETIAAEIELDGEDLHSLAIGIVSAATDADPVVVEIFFFRRIWEQASRNFGNVILVLERNVREEFEVAWCRTWIECRRAQDMFDDEFFRREFARGEDTELDTGGVGSAAPAVTMFIPLRECVDGSPNLWKRVREKLQEAGDDLAWVERFAWAVCGGGEDRIHDGASSGREVVDTAQRRGGGFGNLAVDEGLDLGGEEDTLHGTFSMRVDVGSADGRWKLGDL